MYRARYSNGGASLLGLDYDEAHSKLREVMSSIEGVATAPEKLRGDSGDTYQWELWALQDTYALVTKGLAPVTLDSLMVEFNLQNEQT